MKKKFQTKVRNDKSFSLEMSFNNLKIRMQSFKIFRFSELGS